MIRVLHSTEPLAIGADATVAEMALRQPGPVAMPTSDVDGMAKLCGDRVRLITA